MDVGTETIRFVVDPVAFIYVSVDMNELAMAMSPVVPPLPLIAGAIGPYLCAVSVAEPANPLSLVGRSRLEGVQGPLLSLALRVVVLLV
jgi:hypothetical protein